MATSTAPAAPAKEDKVKLPADLTTWSLSDLKKYIDSHLPGGHKRRLAEEILRLRKGK